ncbi:hypothetical protein BIY24_14240 [Halobacteriovorax marinus]|uniref:hypothetical protein n=1 Tax=Halobacteriovorax marinus TaxID=97084 RepID=UPI000BC3009F|nr:hypothetical protein [Halobacteriovorax marinus]ATH09060.1 hypothetical protein BIY24_14240 [Halobacteriovorax marinus]
MQLFKFSILFLLLNLNINAMNMFSDMDCIQGSFDAVVEHKAAPFGLSKNILTVSKNDCSISISHSKLKFMKNNWNIDVCRAPVHIKKDEGGVNVIKRGNGCKEGSSDFCKELSMIEKILQDDGLIFATGEKENISSDHGKIYCAYLLTKKYLREGIVFNRGRQYEGVLSPVKVKMNTSNVMSDVKEANEPSEVSKPLEDGPADF